MYSISLLGSPNGYRLKLLTGVKLIVMDKGGDSAIAVKNVRFCSYDHVGTRNRSQIVGSGMKKINRRVGLPRALTYGDAVIARRLWIGRPQDALPYLQR